MVFDNLDYKDLIMYFEKHQRDAADSRILLLEECAELAEVMARTFRSDRDVELEHIAEEMTHVFLMMTKVALHFGITSEMAQKEVDKKREKYGLI